MKKKEKKVGHPDATKTVTLTGEEIKRLDAVAEFKQDPLEPFIKLIDFLRTASAQGDGDQVSISRTDLINLIPKRSQLLTLVQLLPYGLSAQLNSNDADYNLYDHGQDSSDPTDTADSDPGFPDKDHYNPRSGGDDVGRDA